MKQFKIKKNYLLLKNWWETIDLTNYEKSIFNREIIAFNQQLFRLKERKIRIGTYGKSGVGKSSVLNSFMIYFFHQPAKTDNTASAPIMPTNPPNSSTTTFTPL